MNDADHRGGAWIGSGLPAELVVPMGYLCPKTDRCGYDCTNRQRKIHKTEVRLVYYPWHPWYGRSLLIRESLVKGGLADYRCCLEVDDRAATSLEIPQWMFDRAICCSLLSLPCNQSGPNWGSAQPSMAEMWIATGPWDGPKVTQPSLKLWFRRATAGRGSEGGRRER